MRNKLLASLLITVLAVTVMTSLSGCGSSAGNTGNSGNQQSSAKKQYTVAVLVSNMPDPFFVSVYYGFVQEAQKLGVKLVMQDAGGYTNASKQANQIDEMVANKVDAIDLCAVSPAASKPAVDRAWQAGIPVFGWCSYTNGKMASFVGSSNEQLGGDEAAYMDKALNGHGNVVMIDGPGGVSWSVERATAFRNAVKTKYPGLHILAEKWVQSDRPSGMSTMENLLQTFPNINGVYTGSDANGDGVAAALVAAGKTGKIVETTAVMEPDTKTYIEKGVISMTAAQQAILIGEKTLETTVQYLDHQQVPQTVVVPDMIVTKDNVKTIDTSTIQSPADFKP